jgi:prefoldin subunit 5
MPTKQQLQQQIADLQADLDEANDRIDAYEEVFDKIEGAIPQAEDDDDEEDDDSGE